MDRHIMQCLLAMTLYFSALAQKARYYPWGCVAPSRDTEKYANIADASFQRWADAKGQIGGNTKHDWCYDDGYVTTAPVGSFPDGASQFGVLDMNGNVGEWCLDEGPDDASSHVNRGGTWGGAAMYDPDFDDGHDTHFISTWLKVADPGADDRTGFRIACTCDGVNTCTTDAKVEDIPLVKITAGSFTSGWGGIADVPKDPVQQISISSDFWIGKHEVTKGQFRSFVTTSQYTPDMSKGGSIQGEPCFVKHPNKNTWIPDSSKNWDTAVAFQDDSHPVSCVTWADAKAYTEWLTTHSNTHGWTCTLPTAAQWEYAARGTQAPCSSDHPDNFDSIKTSACQTILSLSSSSSSTTSPRGTSSAAMQCRKTAWTLLTCITSFTMSAFL